MSNQKSDHELAYGEIKHALGVLGPGKAFHDLCDIVEKRLIQNYPDNEHGIIEMIEAWLVHLGVHPEGELQGKV